MTLHRRDLSITRTAEILALAGLLDDDRVPSFTTLARERLALLPAPMAADVQDWLRVRSQGGPRSRPRDEHTGPPRFVEAPQPGEDGAMSNPRYTAEMRERAVKMVMQVRRESGQEKGAVARVAQQLGIGREALRGWVAQAEVDSGARPGTTSDDKQRIKELERENSELRRANEILKAASAYFARELGPSLPR